MFEIRQEVADLRFKVEKLDNKLTMLLTICSLFLANQLTHDSKFQAMSFSDIPIPLRLGHSLNPHEEQYKYKLHASHGFNS